MPDQIWTAIIGGGAGFCAGLIGGWIQYQRMRREFALQDKAEAAAKDLLNSNQWEKRSFDAIKDRLGGFEDNELRKILVAAGAVRFRSQDGKELWGLKSRNPDVK
jgi:hypothetical protein